MKPHRRLFALALPFALLACSCAGLEYPKYWTSDHNLAVNVITLPFEILITPVIFVLKILPVL